MKQNGQKGFAEQSAVLLRKNGQSGGRVASDGADQRGSVSFLEDTKFFFTLYHAGKVNITLHMVSFLFLFYGLIVKSVSPMLIGTFVFDEMGHAYNYFVVHNRDPRFGLRMIPYQFLYGSHARPAQTFGLVLNSEMSRRCALRVEDLISLPPLRLSRR